MNTNIFDIDNDQNSSGVYKSYQWLIRKHTPKIDSLRFKKTIICQQHIFVTFIVTIQLIGAEFYGRSD